MTTSIRWMLGHFFYRYRNDKHSLSPEQCEKEWKSQFKSLIDHTPTVDLLWKNSTRLTQTYEFSPKGHHVHLINQALSCAPSHYISAPVPSLAPIHRATHIIVQMLQKLWYNTLRLFTWNYQVKDLENRTFFDLGDFSSKIFNAGRLIGAIALNQYTVELLCSVLAVSTTVAYLAVLCGVITILALGFFFINRYAEKVLAKPLKDPTFGDTVNLTRLMQQSLPLSEAGRTQELDELERTLASPTAEIGVIGEKGCGKSELIKLLAQRIANESCAPHLKGKQLYCVNGAQVTRSYIEKLREQIKGHESEIILCIDECHGIFRAGSSQILKTLGMGGPKPRIIYVTTKSYFESTFLAEEDGSWISRIHPRIEINPINPRDMQAILLGRLQNLLPWIKITHEMIFPFAEIAKIDLRKAIKDIDLFAAHFLKKISSSDALQDAIEEKTSTEAELSSLSLNHSYHEWILSDTCAELAERLRVSSERIETEKRRLQERENLQKNYQAIALLQKKWQAKVYDFWQNPSGTKAARDKQLVAACLWASEAFESKKKEIAKDLITELTVKEIFDWLSIQKKLPTSNPKPSKKTRKSSMLPMGSPTHIPSSRSPAPDVSDNETDETFSQDSTSIATS